MHSPFVVPDRIVSHVCSGIGFVGAVEDDLPQKLFRVVLNDGILISSEYVELVNCVPSPAVLDVKEGFLAKPWKRDSSA